MKKCITLFPRATYQSEAAGAVKTYNCPDAIRKLAGQAVKIRYQVVGYRRSTNARVQLLMWETPHADLDPTEVIPGGSAFFSGTAVTSLRPAPENITGPFADNVGFTLKVDASAGASQEEFDGEVVATLILEE